MPKAILIHLEGYEDAVNRFADEQHGMLSIATLVRTLLGKYGAGHINVDRTDILKYDSKIVKLRGVK